MHSSRVKKLTEPADISSRTGSCMGIRAEGRVDSLTILKLEVLPDSRSVPRPRIIFRVLSLSNDISISEAPKTAS